MPRIYAATAAHLAVLEPHGDGWTVRLGLRDRAVECVAADPTGGATVYAGSRDGSLRYSRDRGDTWHEATLTGDPLHRIRAMAVIKT